MESNKNLVMAICKTTFPDEDDMERYCNGHIKPCDVKIYHKGRKYLVHPMYFDNTYFQLIEKNK